MNKPFETGGNGKIDVETLARWKGRTETLEDTAPGRSPPCRPRSIATIRAARRSSLPALWHWFHFLPHAPQSQLGPDGHPKRGGFCLQSNCRAAWAGGRLHSALLIRIGDAIRRTSTIADVNVKHGRTGPLVSCWCAMRSPVRRAAPSRKNTTSSIATCRRRATPPPAAARDVDARHLAPDPVLLFRYSALTFNGHRIPLRPALRYGGRGLSGLIVCGPLIATLLADLARRNDDAWHDRLRFRAMSPLFDIAPFSVNGAKRGEDKIRLWATNATGGLAMEAEASYA